MHNRSRIYKSNKQDFDAVRTRMVKHNSQLKSDKRNLLKEGERKIESLDPGKIEEHIHMINICYQNNDISNACDSIKEICTTLENGVDILFDRQLFQPILLYMSSGIICSYSTLLICKLTEIIDVSFGSISSILNSDFSFMLKNLLMDNQMKLPIIRLLSKVSNHGKEPCYFIMQMNLMELCNSSTMDNSKEHICSMMKNIFHFKPDGCQVISRDAISLMKPLLANSSNQCKLDIIWSFVYILEEGLISSDDLLERDLVSFFVQMLLNKNELINLPILKIFNYAYFESESCKQFLADNEIFNYIPRIFPFNNHECWRECMFFLTNVASSESKDIVIMRSCNILDWILFSLRTGTYRIQEEAIYFFKNITKEESADQIPFWITKDVISSFCILLQPGNVDINCIILDTMICALLYSYSEQLCNIYTECNVVHAIESSGFHMIDCGFKLYNDLISILSGEDETQIFDDPHIIDEANMEYKF